MGDDEMRAPDIAGERPECPNCGTSVKASATVQIGCPCGLALEAWPEVSGG